MSHYEERLENDLAKVRASIDDLSALVLEALRNAVRAVLESNKELAHQTVIGDHPINRDSRDIDRLCHAFIARHLPSAGHLRLMSSVIRTNVALERIGDYAVTISREALLLSEPPPDRVAQQMQTLADRSLQVLEDSVAAFRDGNAEAARTLMTIPAQLESGMDDIYERLIDKAKKRQMRETVAEFVILSLLKRVADQAKNICDQTVFSAAGEIKEAKHFQILFVDRKNDGLSRMAEAIGAKRFSEYASFTSAGSDPADEVDPQLIAFLDQHGVEVDPSAPRGTGELQDRMQLFDIIIRVGKMDGKVLEHLPFHTSAFRWETTEVDDDADEQEKKKVLEDNYRFLSLQIEDLMQVIAGTDAD